jgi:lantibiotic modifying enzyme
MLAALHMFRASGEMRWRDLYRHSVDALWRTWTWDAPAGCHLWTQDLYGRTDQLLGAAHGFAGNAFALLSGDDLLDDARRESLHERCAQALQATAIVADGGANWPPSARGKDAKLLVQWCHGAPGIVTGLARLRRGTEVDRLLDLAGETIWRAGPLAKGSGLCHGTAGNGYAFLKLYRRTGDDRWLDRARAFAMHAIAQSEAARERFGQGRYTLFTGDPGVAWYLWSCVTATDAWPLLDAA